MARRNPRTDALVRDALARIIEQDVADPRLRFITITEVEVTADQKYATIWWLPLEPGVLSEAARVEPGEHLPTPEQMEAGLASAAPRIRAILGNRIKLRNTPELRFQRDETAGEASRVEALLRELRSNG